MIISTVTDRRYVELTGVMLRSACANAAIRNVELIVFGDRLRRVDKDAIQASADRSVRFVDLETQRERISAFRTNSHWPTAVYGRLIAPDLIADQGKMLYVDCDTIIHKSLADLEALDMDGKAVAAVRGRSSAKLAAFNGRYGRPFEMETFNSGVMLIDLDEWRRQNLTEKLLSWISAHHGKTVGLCQDPLNVVLGEDWIRLPGEYNFQGRDAALGEFSEARVIHFTGSIKPDHVECPHAATPIYLQHRANTPFGKHARISRLRRRAQKLFGSLTRHRVREA